MSDQVNYTDNLKKINQVILLENKRLAFPNINLIAFQHPFDYKASQSISKIPAIKDVFKFLNKFFSDDIIEFEYLVTAIKVTKNQFPKLYSVFEEARNILDMNN